MWPFKKKNQEEAQQGSEEIPQEAMPPPEQVSTAPASVEKIGADLGRLEIQFNSFKEIRNAFSERFTHISEQIGELRSMILDRDREFRELEAKSLKSIDMVEAVQPDKLMMAVQKGDVAITAVKSKVESLEELIHMVQTELKEIREKIKLFRGLEEVAKMNDEVKNEIIEMKKIEAKSAGHADRVGTIFLEIEKKFKDIETFKDRLRDTEVAFRSQNKDMDTMKLKLENFVKKDELEKAFEKIKRHIEGLEKIAGKTQLAKDLDALKDMLDELKL